MKEILTFLILLISFNAHAALVCSDGSTPYDNGIDPIQSISSVTEYFASDYPIEIWGSLPIRDYPRMGSPIRQRIAEIHLPNSKAGDIVQFNFGFEVTNNQYYAVELTGKIILTQELYPSIVSIKDVSKERGYNVSPQNDQYGKVFHGMHHGIVERSGTFVIPEDGDYFIAAIFYAGGSSFTQTSEALKIESNYGDFNAIRIRNN